MIFPRHLNNFSNDLKSEEYKKFISKLVQLKFLQVPAACSSCGETNIHVQNLSTNVNSKVCFRCMACKNIMSIRQHSFFERHPKIPLRQLFDMIRCFTLFNFNAEETVNFLFEEHKYEFIKETVLIVFNELRQELRQYYHRVYQKPFIDAGNLNFTDFSIVAVDEAIFALEKVYEDKLNKKEYRFAETDEKQEAKDEEAKKNPEKKLTAKQNKREEQALAQLEQKYGKLPGDKELNKLEKKQLLRHEALEKQADDGYHDKFEDFKQADFKNKEEDIKEMGKNKSREDELKELVKDKQFSRKYKVSADGKIRPTYRLRPYWVLGMINTVTQDFRVMLIPDRCKLTLNYYLTKYVKEFNEIITDGYKAYSFLDADILSLKIDMMLKSLRNKGDKLTKDEIQELNVLYNALTNIKNYYCYTGRKYLHRSYNHSKFEFGRGLESTAHIEGLWGNLKSLIRGIYHQIPAKNLLLFLKEAEWKFKMRGLSYKEKLIFLAEIINSNREFYDRTEGAQKQSLKKDQAREKAEELDVALFKTEQPQPISKRIQNLLLKYRNIRDTHDKKLNLKGLNEKYGAYLNTDVDVYDKVQNQFPLNVKKKLHQNFIGLKNKRHRFRSDEFLRPGEELTTEEKKKQEKIAKRSKDDFVEMSPKKLERLQKIDEKVMKKTHGVNNFIDNYFVKVKAKSVNPVKEEQKKEQIKDQRQDQKSKQVQIDKDLERVFELQQVENALKRKREREQAESKDKQKDAKKKNKKPVATTDKQMLKKANIQKKAFKK